MILRIFFHHRESALNPLNLIIFYRQLTNIKEPSKFSTEAFLTAGVHIIC